MSFSDSTFCSCRTPAEKNNTITNILYFIFGGGVVAFFYLISGIFFCCTIYFYSTGIALINLSSFIAFPLRKGWFSIISNVCSSSEYSGPISWGIRALLWAPFIIIIGVTHLLFFIILAIPIITIPIAHLHWKLISFVLFPIVYIDEPSMQNRLAFY